MSETEKRYVEFRADGDAIEGTLIRYGDKARIGAFTEQFRAGCFTLRDPIANLHHDRGKPVAREGAGLTLSDGPDRLAVRIDLPDTPPAREARELISAGIVRGFSVEFRSRKDRWDGSDRTVLAADLIGFGLVDRPAYPDSTIADRFEEWSAPVRRRRDAL